MLPLCHRDPATLYHNRSLNISTIAQIKLPTHIIIWTSQKETYTPNHTIGDMSRGWRLLLGDRTASKDVSYLPRFEVSITLQVV